MCWDSRKIFLIASRQEYALFRRVREQGPVLCYGFSDGVGEAKLSNGKKICSFLYKTEGFLPCMFEDVRRSV